jgi:hypothetical protein
MNLLKSVIICGRTFLLPAVNSVANFAILSLLPNLKYWVRNLLLPGLLLPNIVFAQSEPAASAAPKQTAGPNNSAIRSPQKQDVTPTPSPVSRQQLDRLTGATEKLLTRIQKEENDLYLRVNYFEKPDRLEPNSYASKEEVAQWQGMLSQLKEKHDLVAQLYANFSKDLETELKQTGANEQLVARFKQTVIEGFPWDTINKKKQLIGDYIDEHGKLLTFYDKNWGNWKAGTETGKPEFKSPTATTIYNKLREQIVATGDEIEKQYKTMTE